MTKQLIAATVLLISASSCFATGWNDYQLDIGDGYIIYRHNSIEIGIGRIRGKTLTGGKSHAGPLQEYAVTDDYIFAWHCGRRGRDLDKTKEYWYVIEKITDKVVGPVSREKFNELPEVKAALELDWQRPKNPHGAILALVPFAFLAAVIFIFYLTYQICYASIDFIARLFSKKPPEPKVKTIGTKIKRIIICGGILIPIMIFIAATIIEANLPTNDHHIGDGFRVYTPEENYSVLLPADGYHNTSSSRVRWDLVGPLQQYISTDEYVFTKCSGKRFLDGRGQEKISGLYDRPYEPDYSMEFFYVYLKEDKNSFGPLYREDFEARSEVEKAMPLSWQDTPKPVGNMLGWLAAGIQFYVAGVIVFALYFGWIIAIPMGLLALTRWCIRSKKAGEDSPIAEEKDDD